MQTFLPYPDFAKSANCLDRQRLGKQRVEILQILRACLYGTGWRHHPAVKMWKGYEACLVEYGFAICDEWHHVRGYLDTCAGQISDIMLLSGFTRSVDPPWLGNRAFHRSHKSNLIRKLPEHYGKLWPDIPADLPYVWPSNLEQF